MTTKSLGSPPTTRRASEDAEVFQFLSLNMKATQIAYSTGWSLAKAKAVIARVTAKEPTQ